MNHFMLVFLLLPIGNLLKAQSDSKPQSKMTNLISNSGDVLFSTIYPNPEKETIVLLHGGPGFPSDLKEVVEILSRNYQVISFHQRGTKQSPCNSHDYSMKAYVVDIDAVTKFYKLSRFHLFGHSWGGLYAQIYTQEYPEKIISLFLCCPGSGTGIEWKQTEKEVMQLNKLKTTNFEWMKMGINNLFGMLGSDNAYKRLFKQVMKNYNRDFIAIDNLGIDFDNLRAEPINMTRKEIVKYPILLKVLDPNFKISIVYGDNDIYQTSKDFVLNRFPTAKVSTIERSGHIPWLHNPAKYKSVLLEHFNQ